MKKILFNTITKDFIEFIKNNDSNKDFLTLLKSFSEERRYEDLFETFKDIIHLIYRYKGWNIGNFFGAINICIYVNSFNKKFYSHLSQSLKKDGSSICLRYSKFMDILIERYKEPDRELYADILSKAASSKTGAVRIVYKDKNGKITKRVITNISFNLEGFYEFNGGISINAFCLLRGAERNFLLGSILELEHFAK